MQNEADAKVQGESVSQLAAACAGHVVTFFWKNREHFQASEVGEILRVCSSGEQR